MSDQIFDTDEFPNSLGDEDLDTSTGDAMKQAAARAAEFVKRQADDRARRLGGTIHKAADSLESTGVDLEDRGQSLSAGIARQLAKKARGVGDYLENTDTRTMLEDAGRFTREQPWTALAIGALAGFALSRMLKNAMPKGASTNV